MYMMGAGTGPCAVCRDRHGDYSKECALKAVDQILQGVPSSHKTIRFNWAIHSHCRYGLHCDTLRQNDSKLTHLAERLNARLTTVVYSTDTSLYEQCYRQLQGHFSQVCYTMELERAKALDKQGVGLQ